MNENLFKIAITHGDLNGVGYELILKALCDNKITEICSPVVYGIAKVCSFYKNQLELSDFSLQVIKKVEQINLKKSNLLNVVEQEVKVEPGQKNDMASKMVELSYNAVLRDLKAKQLDAVVTAPVEDYAGQSEYLARHCGSQNTMELLIDGVRRVAFAFSQGTHADSSNGIDKDLVLSKLKSLVKILRRDLRCPNPKIAVLSMQPDAKELSKDDQEILLPAVDQAFEERMNVFGPFVAADFINNGRWDQFDAVLVMKFHDFWPVFKTQCREDAVFYTAGLPFVKTSPVNDVAYELAGKNVSDGQSMRNAVYFALDVLKYRQIMSEYAKK